MIFNELVDLAVYVVALVIGGSAFALGMLMWDSFCKFTGDNK